MELKPIIAQFLGDKASEVAVNPITNGHINHTYLVEEDGGKKYILQKVNTSIFTNPQAIAHNHLEINKILEGSGYHYTLLNPLKTQKGNYFDELENSWRMLEFIEGCNTFTKVPDGETAYRAAAALSEFYSVLNSHNDRVQFMDPLPGFINFKKRIDDFKTVLGNADGSLKEKARNEIDFINRYIDLPNLWIEKIASGALPQRIIHADPKISNVLFNDSNEAMAVIDLDTVMYGPLLYDFGDMIRSYTNTSDEDDGITADNFSPQIFEQVKKGFLSHLSNVLTPEEQDMMDYAAQTVIYIQAVRFLTDYLDGSRYYAVKYPEHNLDRTKNQITLVKGVMQHTGHTAV